MAKDKLTIKKNNLAELQKQAKVLAMKIETVAELGDDVITHVYFKSPSELFVLGGLFDRAISSAPTKKK